MPIKHAMPFLRWAGSKHCALNRLESVFRNYEYDLYVDPFVGAGSVFFNLAKEVKAVVSDSNLDLISFYRFLKLDPDALWQRLSGFRSRISKVHYQQVRKRYNLLPQGLDRAATFFFLNRTCFNGIYRVNQLGEFNVPVGSRRIFKYPSLEEFRELSDEAQRAEIVHCDFSDTLKHARVGALFYLDPPYTDLGDSRGYDRYSWPPFQRSDLKRLETFIVEIVRKGANVIVSYSGSKTPWFVPSQFNIMRLKVFRSISCDGARGNRVETCTHGGCNQSSKC